MKKLFPRWALCMVVIVLQLATSLQLNLTPALAQDNGQTIFLPFVAGGGATTATEANFLTGTNQIIVGYEESVQAAAADHAAQVAALNDVTGVEVAYERTMSGNAIVVKLPQWIDLGEAASLAEAMMALPEVAYAEPDRIMQPTQTPNDSFYSQQWDFFAPATNAYGANLPPAWDITTGSASTVVAVVDTGYRPHADLSGRFLPGYDFISDSRIGNDGNARDSDASDPGDWITAAESASGFFAGCPVSNSSWHGTHVAGTIAANANNGAGVAGINWQAKILPVRVLGKCGGYTSDIADGIRWSAGLSVSGVATNPNPARVINMSLGGSGSCTSTFQNAINAAVNAGTVVVVAAGNSNANAANYSPASCANVITVAATGPTGNRAYYSNYGSTVEISAPGGDKSISGDASGILSTLNTGTTTPGADSYASYQGTSMATPHVVGIVSLLLAVDPTLTPAQVTTLLQANVTPFPAGSSCNTANCGPGIVNAGAAVAAAQGAGSNPPGAFAKSAPASGTTLPSTSTTLSWGVSVGATSYAYCFDTTNDSACSNWVSTGSATSATISGLVAGNTYYWQVRATNSNGTTEASGGWWSFSVAAGSPPAAFNKTSPSNGGTGGRNSATIRWNSSSGATGYEVCIDTTNNNSCDGSWQSVSGTSATVTGLARRTTYYWQVRAINGFGTTEANGGAWWRFTTR